MRSSNRVLIINLLTTIVFALTMGCVSVNLGNLAPSSDVKKNENVRFTPPPAPFEAFTAGPLDHGWRHPQNGNSISFLSECQLRVDPSLENILAGIVRGMHNARTLSTQRFPYNGREALRSVITGEVDGVASTVDVVILKKNGCNYILTYAALLAHFDENTGDFQNFIDGFRAP